MSGLNDFHLRQFVIEPILKFLDMHSDAAVALVLNTAKVESDLTYLAQLNNGPARGLWQMEPDTHNDIWENYLAYRDDLANDVRSLAIGLKETPDPEQMCGNLFYACAMCRIHYMRVPHALPHVNDVEGQARYWKAHYNTELGAGTPDKFLAAVADPRMEVSTA